MNSIVSQSATPEEQKNQIAKILVVDDEIELQRLIKQRFRKNIRAKEFDFVFVQNGVEALTYSRRSPTGERGILQSE
ncbi:hypothetical protein ACP6PM_00560, partial [Dapis sp. BLCC M229]